MAIKVLPESFAVDADRVARFTREARTLAALNHPNIAAIYGLEKFPPWLAAELLRQRHENRVSSLGPRFFRK